MVRQLSAEVVGRCPLSAVIAGAAAPLKSSQLLLVQADPLHGVQTPTEHLGHVTAVGGRMPTVGEDYLPLHEMSTDSKRTTCLPPHMVCEVHHTKSGYEQLESRSSPCRPTRSSTSPKRMRYDLFRPQFEAESPSGRSARSAFCRTSRSQMGFSQHVPSSLEASKWLGDRRRGCPRYFGR